MENVITLEKFFSLYLGINNRAISKLSHKDIKEMFPNIKRVSLEYAKDNAKEVCMGNIILVSDCKNNVIPYIKPDLVLYEENQISLEYETKPRKKVDVDELENLSNYELRQLLNQRKNGYKIARRARKELNERGYVKTKKRKEDYYD